MKVRGAWGERVDADSRRSVARPDLADLLVPASLSGDARLQLSGVTGSQLQGYPVTTPLGTRLATFSVPRGLADSLAQKLATSLDCDVYKYLGLNKLRRFKP